MSTPKDGGPAFPIPEAKNGIAPGFGGMSLRDWFAAGALRQFTDQRDHQILASETPIGKELCKTMAQAAYNIADAMLEAREAK